jgi:peptidoglycan/xylan/chitin deacetylase (PgdA/CDA1 family)
MRMLSGTLAALCLCAAAIVAARQQGDTAVARWHGRHAAVSLTYDDALVSQLDIAIPQLDAAGLEGTFFLMGRQVGSNVPRWKAAAAAGHELANHTINHPCARGTYETPVQYTSEAYTVDVLLTEVGVMNGFLEAMDGKRDHAFATPCGQTLAGGQDYIAPLQRAQGSTYIRDGKTLPANVRGTGFVNASGDEMIRWVEGVRQAGVAGVIVFHGVGGDYLNVSADAHKQLVGYLKAHEREIWTTTFSELMDAATRGR